MRWWRNDQQAAVCLWSCTVVLVPKQVPANARRLCGREGDRESGKTGITLATLNRARYLTT